MSEMPSTLLTDVNVCEQAAESDLQISGLSGESHALNSRQTERMSAFQ